jgi:hypothetical protein
LSSENNQRYIILPVAATSPQQHAREMKRAKKNEKYNQSHSILYLLPQEVLLVISFFFTFDQKLVFFLYVTDFFLFSVYFLI